MFCFTQGECCHAVMSLCQRVAKRFGDLPTHGASSFLWLRNPLFVFAKKKLPHSKLIELLIKMVKKNKLTFKTDVQGIDHMNFQNRCEKIDLDVLFFLEIFFNVNIRTNNESKYPYQNFKESFYPHLCGFLFPSRRGCHRHVEPPTYFPKKRRHTGPSPQNLADEGKSPYFRETAVGEIL